VEPDRLTSDAAQNRFVPPFCPNPACRFHQPRSGWNYKWAGWFTRPSDQRRFRCFACLHCRTKFSTRTFSSTYWLRRPELLARIADLSVSGAGLRQIGRHLCISHTTVARHLARLARQCLLFHHHTTHNAPITEPIAVDGFETFVFSQFFPCHFHLAAGRNSWFLYHFTDSPLRRKGRMTDEQRRRRCELETRLGRPDPKAVEKDMACLIATLARRVPTNLTLELHSDEHPAYPRAIRRARRSIPQPPVINHLTTPSTEPRTLHNPLFPVNLADLLLRHCGANHRRETIAFSKRLQAAIERLAVFTVWRNFIKKQREKGPAVSAAMLIGVAERLLRWTDVLQQRLFPGHADLPPPWDDYYRRRVKTAVYGRKQAVHCLRYGF